MTLLRLGVWIDSSCFFAMKLDINPFSSSPFSSNRYLKVGIHLERRRYSSSALDIAELTPYLTELLFGEKFSGPLFRGITEETNDLSGNR